MKLSISVLVAFFTATKASPGAIEQGAAIVANSKAGMSLLSKARRVEDNGEEDFTWLVDYSIKFQGCHHVKQWNEEAEGEEDVRISTKRLVRFRLCPSNSCTAENGGGCSSGYGDYIVDMNTFIDAYIDNKNEVQEQACEYTMENVCNCDDDQCEYNCFSNLGMDYCIEQEADDGAEPFELEDYVECGEIDIDNGRRRLNDAEVEYFVGPYCASQGGKIFLGLFTDETCSAFADDYGGKNVYKKMIGSDLPYSETSVVDADCYSCVQDDDNDDNNQAEAKEFCMDLYQTSGKCENEQLGTNSRNKSACNYMKGIKITRSNGVIISGAANKNKVATAFIGIFVVSFILLGAYVYYLKTKLDRAKINLSD